MARGLRTLLIFCGLFVVHFLSEQHVMCAKGLTRESSRLSYANFVEHLFHYLNVSQVGSSHIDDFKHCAYACLRVVTCFSFNVAAHRDINGQFLCELLASDKYNSSDKFQPSELFHHFSIFNPCSENPCTNGGKCIALYVDNDFECKCPPGFIGNKCELASFDLQFTRNTTEDFVIHHELLLSNAFTVCYRVRTTEPPWPNTWRVVFSYATKTWSNEIFLIKMNGTMRFALGGEMRYDIRLTNHIADFRWL